VTINTDIIWFIVDTGGSATAYGSAAVNDTSKWYHLVGVYDGSNVVVYIDGVGGTPTADTGNIDNSGQSLRISGYGNGGNPVNGLIDDVRIYNYARSAEQVKQDYNQGAGVKF